MEIVTDKNLSILIKIAECFPSFHCSEELNSSVMGLGGFPRSDIYLNSILPSYTSPQAPAYNHFVADVWRYLKSVRRGDRAKVPCRPEDQVRFG